MAWLKSHQELPNHPKLLDLSAAMNWDEDLALGKLHRFWYWCMDYAEDGDLRKHNDDRLARAVGLNGEAGKRFVKAMILSCWIDQKPYFRVHDWWEYAGGWLLAKYKRSPSKWEKVRDSYVTVTATAKEEIRGEERTDNYRNGSPPAVDFSEYRVPFGKLKGVHILSLALDECHIYLKSRRLSAEFAAALKWRISLKAMEKTGGAVIAGLPALKDAP